MPEEISVVTPTLRRPQEVSELLANLARQTLLPSEFILVDGAPESEPQTRVLAQERFHTAPFPCRYIAHSGGTAIQRNVGIHAAKSGLIALIDDDIRLAPGFLSVISKVFEADSARSIGGVVGYRTNEYFESDTRTRWRWYRRLGLLKQYEPGRYDRACGYPINANMQPPFSGVREVDFMTTACAVWRREVFDSGLTFDPFFIGYGVLEDAHFSLRAGEKWKLLQCGDAKCEHLHSPNGRTGRGRIGYMCVVNYYHVFRDIAGPLSFSQRRRFWTYQAFEAFRVLCSAIRNGRRSDVEEIIGRLNGWAAVATGRAWRTERAETKK